VACGNPTVMDRAVQSEKSNQQQPAAASGARRGVTRSAAPGASRLGQLAAGINSSPLVQRLAQLKQEIQRSARVQGLERLAGEIQPEAPAQLEAQPVPSPNRTGLPDQLKAGVESLSGLSMDEVKVHYNSPKPAQLNALAYAQGTDIHVAPGQEKHLPHEAWHVAQQAQGRVKPTTQAKGANINDDFSLEREADVMGMKAATMQTRRAVATEINHGEPVQLHGVTDPSPLTSFSPSGVVVFQLHKGKDQYDETLDSMLIYKVVEKESGDVVYVGQTEESVGLETRFTQHLSSGYHDDWSKGTHKIMKLEAGSWTRFETDCAEQYWIDDCRKNGAKLDNGKNQVSNSRFQEILKYQEQNGLKLFRGEEAKFPRGWHPAK
jgi:Domain of unknown function (DUF4157)